MKTALIYGSVREHREGYRAARSLKTALEARDHEVELIDPMDEAHQLPLLNKMYKEYGDGEAPENVERIGRILDEADGFVIVTGEYNHSVPPALKNLLDHYQKEYQFKPSGIVSYSAGSFGGVRSAVHLRVIMAELGSPTISSILPVPKVQDSLKEDGTAFDGRHDDRVSRFLDEYEWYLRALKREREEGKPF
jgi:NAD(P)H-dependent FMN reductase